MAVNSIGRTLTFMRLFRVKSWRSNDSKYTALEIKVDDKTICVNCGHYGRVQKHVKSGCGQCRMNVGCDASLWKYVMLSIIETNIGTVY